MADIGNPYATLPNAYISFVPGANPQALGAAKACGVARNGGVGLYRITLDRELAAGQYECNCVIDPGVNLPFDWSLVDTSNVFKDLKLALGGALTDPSRVTITFRRLA